MTLPKNKNEALNKKPEKKISIAIFASGMGSNANKIILYFASSTFVKVGLVVCNKAGAGVIEVAKNHNVPLLMINSDVFFKGDGYVDSLNMAKIDYIILAGFLWKIPATVLEAFYGRIINIHPALLPRFGGKGMYGSFVHKAVIAAEEKQSGITIHEVNEHYDEGTPVFQAMCDVDADETPETLANKIHVLEHEHYPKVIEKWILDKESSKRA